MKKINKSLYVSLILFLFFSARVVFADVVISEIAWMGTATSSSNEWIELYNNGSSSIDLSGWTLKTDDGDLSISLSGSISPYGFYLIERTDDETVQGIPADLIASFGHGLSNSGETLILKNNSGGDADTLAFYSGWPKGDNTTKETMQRLNSSWITAPATPKSATPGASTVETPTDNTDDKKSTSDSTKSSTTGSTVKKELTPPKFTAEIIAPSLATVGVGLPIKASIKYGTETFMVGDLKWNFGDGSTKEQTQVEPFTHTYMYSGEYVLTLSYKKYMYQMTPVDATDRVIISVLPPGVTISSVGNGSDPYVELENISRNEVELSGWILKSMEEFFTIPEGTIILPSKKLIFGSSITHFTFAHSVSLLRPSGQITAIFPTTIAPRVASTSGYTKPRDVIEDVNSNIDLSENLSAQAGNTGFSFPFEIVGALILAVIGMCVAYFLTAKKDDADDILLTQDDIKIIE